MCSVGFSKTESKALKNIFVREGPNFKAIKVIGALQFTGL